jgi:hypothetical protein
MLNKLKIKPIKSYSNPIKEEEKFSPKIEPVKIFNSNEKTLVDSKDLNLKITQNENDSDDDLIPFDTSNDVPMTKQKKPAYLRDCLHSDWNL